MQDAAANDSLTTAEFASQVEKQRPEIIVQNDNELVIKVADKFLALDASTGLLKSFARPGKAALSNGPRLLRSDNSRYEGQYNGIGSWKLHDPNASEQVSDASLTTQYEGDDLLISVANPPAGFTQLQWIVRAEGYLSLDVEYELNGNYILHGIAFNYPQQSITRKRWLGDGPYRVWANRMEGVSYSVWENEYNEGIAGESWEFPEFKGYFSDIQWLTLGAYDQEVHFSVATPDIFARVMQPEDGVRPDNTVGLTYDGEISFLHRINAIGTKFHAAYNMGPQGEEVAEQGTRRIKLNIF